MLIYTGWQCILHGHRVDRRVRVRTDATSIIMWVLIWMVPVSRHPWQTGQHPGRRWSRCTKAVAASLNAFPGPLMVYCQSCPESRFQIAGLSTPVLVGITGRAPPCRKSALSGGRFRSCNGIDWGGGPEDGFCWSLSSIFIVGNAVTDGCSWVGDTCFLSNAPGAPA